jgi:hypothetical protein
MSVVAAAVIGSAVVGAGASAYTSGKAADAAKDANDDTLSAQDRIYQQEREDKAPYRDLGTDAMPEYYKMLGLDYTDPVTGDVTKADAGEAPALSPLGQWQSQEFAKTQNRLDASRGLSGSGGASARLGEGYSQIFGADYDSAYGRILDALKLGSGNGSSAGAANTYSGAVGQAGQNEQNITLNQGQSDANFWQGLGNAPGQAIGIKNSMAPGGSGGAPSSNNYDTSGPNNMGSGGNFAIPPGM